MVKTAPSTILLGGRPRRFELPAGGAITPGHLVTPNTSGNLVVAPTALLRYPAIIAAENEIVGKGIADAYASGERVLAWACQGGEEIYALVAAAASAIVIGNHLEAAADGTLRLRTTGETMAIALQAVDNSAGGSPARIRVMIA
jgi:hypothetical protein